MISISTVFDRTTGFIADHQRALLPLALLALLASAGQEIAAPLTETATPAVKAALALLRIALIVLSLFAQLGMIALALQIAPGESGPTRVAARRLPAAIGVYLAMLVALAVAAAPAAIAFHAAGVDFAATTPPATPPHGPGLIVGVLWSVALLVALMWASARLLPIGAVIVGERRGLGAIGRAIGLTRGISWKLIGTLLLFAIVLLIATLATKGVVGSVLALLLGGEGVVTPASVITAIATAAVSTGFSVLAAVFTAMLYRALAGEGAPRTAP